MTESTDQRSLTIRTMVVRAQDEFGGFRHPRDYELVFHLMATAYDNGFALEHLARLKHSGIYGYGFFRDKQHIASIVSAQELSSNFGWGRFAVLASTTDELSGFWAFILDDDCSLLISRDSQPCTQIGELEGSDLMTAVIVSALTEPLEQKLKRGLFRW